MSETAPSDDAHATGPDPPADGSPPPFVPGEASCAEKLKKSWWTRTSSYRMGEGQFGLSAMLGLTVAVAVLFSVAGISGMGFLGFFVFLWIVAYLFGPFVIFLVLVLCPGVNPRNRRWVAAVVAVPLLLSASAFAAEIPVAPRDLFAYVFNALTLMLGTLVCAWGPQTLWLWVLFSWRPIGELPRRRKPAVPAARRRPERVELDRQQPQPEPPNGGIP